MSRFTRECCIAQDVQKLDKREGTAQTKDQPLARLLRDFHGLPQREDQVSDGRRWSRKRDSEGGGGIEGERKRELSQESENTFSRSYYY